MDDIEEFIRWADRSSAVTWAGKLGLKERWLNRDNPEYQQMLKDRKEKPNVYRRTELRPETGAAAEPRTDGDDVGGTHSVAGRGGLSDEFQRAARSALGLD